MIKLLATDIDGTLLDEHRFIATVTATAFESLDIPKILVSARMPSAMYYLQEAINANHEPIICYNGALTLHNGNVLFNKNISFNIIQELLEIGQEFGLHVSIYRNDEWFVIENDPWTQREINNTRVQPTIQSYEVTMDYLKHTQNLGGAHKIMYMGNEDSMNSAFAKAEKQKSSIVHLYRSKNTYTEITPAETSKKVALEHLLVAQFPEIAMSEVVAFGDNYNDIDMLKAVGYGVCTANAVDKLKECAGYETLHHKEHGVAHWIQQNKELFK